MEREIQGHRAEETVAADQKPIVLITGSSGLIGARLTKELAPHHTIVGLDLKPPDEETSRLQHWIETDLTDENHVGQVLQTVEKQFGRNLTSVIHLAAYYDFSGRPSPLYRELTVEGTRRLLKGLHRFSVDQLIFSSTLLVMAPTDEQHRISEMSPIQAKWDYPRSKVEAEAVIRQHHGNIPIVILRIAGVYDEDCHSIPIAQQISRIYERRLESYLFPGDAKHGQAFVHLDDLIDCFRQAVGRRSMLDREEIFLVAEPEVLSYEELQDRIGHLIHGSDWPTIRIPKAIAKVGAWVQGKLSTEENAPFIKPWMIDLADDHYAVDIHHAHERLGWEPKHHLRTTLPEMIRRLQEDPERWYRINGLPLPEAVAAH